MDRLIESRYALPASILEEPPLPICVAHKDRSGLETVRHLDVAEDVVLVHAVTLTWPSQIQPALSVAFVH